MVSGTTTPPQDPDERNPTTPGAAGRRSVPLATRFLVAFIAAAVLPLLAIGIFQIVSSYTVQRAQVEDLQHEAARGAANTIDAYLAQFEDQMTLTARELSRQTGQPRLAFLEALLAYNPGFETLTLMDETGQEVVKTSRYVLFGPEDLSSRASDPEFQTPMQGQRYLSPVAVSLYGEPVVTLAIPIRNVRDEVEGVLAAELNLKYMWFVIARMEIGRGGYAYVVDGEGQLIAHRDSSLVLRGRNLSELEGVRSALLDQDIAGPYMGLENQEVIGSYRPLQQADWFVLVEAPSREALAEAYLVIVISVVAIVVTLSLAILLGWYMARIIVQPVRRLQEGAAIIGGGDLAHRIDTRSRDEIGALARAFNAMAAQLQEMVGTLEQRVAERTRGLQTAAEVSRVTTSVLDPDELLRQTVDLARERFNLYYVGLFLLDEERRFAILRAGTGVAGQQMLAEGHRLPVGGDSMIGQCVAQAEARIALDVGEEAVRFDNPLLPDTRSELALPLRSRGRVIGAMTVQSMEEAAFDEASIAVMQTMADQVAVAIDNARLFAETQVALEEMEATQRRYLGQAWAEYGRIRTISGYEQTQAERKPLRDEVSPGVVQAVAERRAIVLGDDEGTAGTAAGSALFVPVVLRDQPIGALGLRETEGKRSWSAEDIALAQAISDQFALAADNLRLLDETQRRAAHDRAASEISARIRETLDVETVLRTAVREIGETLDLHDVTIRLEVDVDRTD